MDEEEQKTRDGLGRAFFLADGYPEYHWESLAPDQKVYWLLRADVAAEYLGIELANPETEAIFEVTD